MVSYTANPPARLRRQQLHIEVQEMLRTPAVMVTLIIASAIVAVGLLGVIGVLLFYGKDTTALLTLVNLIITAVGVKATYTVAAKAERIEQNTNGTTTRLMDHALGPQPGSD